MQQKLAKRGAVNSLHNQIQCNYDGSYGAILIENHL